MRLKLESSKGTDLEKAAVDQLRRRLSPGVFFCNRSRLERGELFQFGISTPRMIIDRGKGRPCISYIPVRDVFSAKVMRSDHKGYLLETPSALEVHRAFTKRCDNLLVQAENVLLGNIGQNLARIGRVQNGLNPFKEILVSLYHMQEIPLRDLFGRYPRKKRERMEKYLKFLVDLGYVVQEPTRIVPGNELIKFEVARPLSGGKDITEMVLGDLICRGREYITRKLSIYMLEPYLSLASTMYLHSFLAGSDIRMTVKDIHNYIRNTYPNIQIKSEYHLNSYLQEMKGVEMIDSDGRYYMGLDEIFGRFQEEFTKVAAL